MAKRTFEAWAREVQKYETTAETTRRGGSWRMVGTWVRTPDGQAVGSLHRSAPDAVLYFVPINLGSKGDFSTVIGNLHAKKRTVRDAALRRPMPASLSCACMHSLLFLPKRDGDCCRARLTVSCLHQLRRSSRAGASSVDARWHRRRPSGRRRPRCHQLIRFVIFLPLRPPSRSRSRRSPPLVDRFVQG